MIRIGGVAMLVVGIAAMWTIAGTLYPTLPPQIPLHFDGSGSPDRWGPPNFWNWFLLPSIGTVVPLFLTGIAAVIPWLLRNYPGLVSIPRRVQFLALPPDGQRRALTALAGMLLWISTVLVWMFAGMIYATALVARGTWSGMPLWVALIPVGAILAIALFGNFLVSRRILVESVIASQRA
ncbi:MAG: DUF1648 domain-containing protein [Phycisphaerales bacterium]|nr:DUF1648 domain-containing protein [Phycisphaerales bacterium]